MQRRLVLPLVAVAALASSGCYKLDIDASGLAPHVYMSTRTREGGTPQRVGEIDTRVTGAWALFGLIDVRDPDVAGAIQREVTRQNGTGVTGLEIRTEQTFVDGLLAAITFNLYGQRSVFIRGTVVR